MRADKELGQIVTGHILDNGSTSTDDASVCQSYRCAKCQITNRAVTHAQRSIIIGGDDTTNGSLWPGGSKRQYFPFCSQEFLQLTERCASPGGNIQIFRGIFLDTMQRPRADLCCIAPLRGSINR